MELGERYSLTSIRSDGNFGLYVAYDDNEGEPGEIHFPASAVKEEDGSFELKNPSYGLWAYHRNRFNGSNYAGDPDDYAGWLGGNSFASPRSSRYIAAYGLETPDNALPTGTATYTGRSLRADMWEKSGGSILGRDATNLRYRMELTANFADDSLTGSLEMTEIRLPGSAWNAPTGTTGFDIRNGSINDSEFRASLIGTDADPDAPLASSMRDFEGNAIGAFYGPAGNVVIGGVFAAERDDHVIIGTLGGRQQQP